MEGNIRYLKSEYERLRKQIVGINHMIKSLDNAMNGMVGEAYSDRESFEHTGVDKILYYVNCADARKSLEKEIKHLEGRRRQIEEKILAFEHQKDASENGETAKTETEESSTTETKRRRRRDKKEAKT